MGYCRGGKEFNFAYFFFFFKLVTILISVYTLQHKSPIKKTLLYIKQYLAFILKPSQHDLVLIWANGNYLKHMIKFPIFLLHTVGNFQHYKICVFLIDI